MMRGRSRSALTSLRLYAVIAIIGFSGGAVALILGGEDAGSSAAEQSEGEKPAAPEPEIHKTAEGCLADSATLEDLRRQKGELEAKQKELNAREAELKAREQALTEQLKGLAAARDDLEKAEGAKKAENEAKIAKLVETVETMNPKASSTLLASVDEGLATATMARLSTAKLAKIMNVMDPARSTRLSEILAGVARARSKPASHDAAAATTERTPAQSPRTDGPSRGGDTNDGKSHDQASNRTTADGNPGVPRR